MDEKSSLKLQAYHQIKQKILSCEYAPNTILNEGLLHDALRCSRTPIRDALSRLEQEGLVTILPKRGIAVSGISVQDVNMIFEVRMLYEPYALRHYGAQIPYDTLLEFHRKFSGEGVTAAPGEYYQLDDAFHAAVLQATGNRFLLQSYACIHDQNLRFRTMTGDSRRLEQTNREHLEILVACLKQNWTQAAEAMLTHLAASKNSTFDLLLKQQEAAGG